MSQLSLSTEDRPFSIRISSPAFVNVVATGLPDILSVNFNIMGRFSRYIDVNRAIHSRISALASQLTKKTYKQAMQETITCPNTPDFSIDWSLIDQISKIFGDDALVYFIQALLTKTADLNQDQMNAFLSHHLNQLPYILNNWVSIICRAFNSLEVFNYVFSQFTNSLASTPIQELILTFGLFYSCHPDVQRTIIEHVKLRLIYLINLLTESLPDSLLSEILLCIHRLNFDIDFQDSVIHQLYYLYNKTLKKPCPEILADAISQAIKPTDTEFSPAVISATDTDYSELSRTVECAISSLPLDQVIKDWGPASIQSGSFTEAISRYSGKIAESEVSRVIGMICRLQANSQGGICIKSDLDLCGISSSKSVLGHWDIKSFILSIRSLCSNLNWLLIMKQLDYPKFSVPNERAFKLLLTAYREATQSSLPADVLFGKWKNLEAQLSMMRYCVFSDDVSFDSSELLAAFPALEKYTLDTLNHQPHVVTGAVRCWTSAQLIKTLTALSEEPGFYKPVSDIFEYPVRSSPKLLLLALIHSKAVGALYNELLNRLFTLFLTSDSPCFSFFQDLWNSNQQLLANNMIALYDKKPQYLHSIFTIVKVLDIVYAILDLTYCTQFSIELAFLANKHSDLDIFAWTKDNIIKDSDRFVQFELNYILEKIRKQTFLDNEHDMIGTILEAFRTSEDYLSPTDRKRIEDLNFSFLKCSSEPESNMPVSTKLNRKTSKEIPSTIRDDADEYLRKVFIGQLSPRALIKSIRKVLISLHDKESLNCVIHTLIDDYAHALDVSEKERAIRSITLGLIINHNASANYTHKILNAVLSDSDTSPTSKKFRFAVCAVEQYHHQLYKWAFHFEKLLNVPHLPASCPELFKRLQTIHSSYGNSVTEPIIPVDQAQCGKANSKRSYENDDQANGSNNDAGIINQDNQQQTSGSGNGSSDSGGEKNNGPGNGSTDESDGDYSKEAPVQMLARAMPEVKQPTEEIRDQIQFILNNVSFQNLEEKTALLKKIIQPSHFDYFAQHVVVYRVSKSANFQSLYSELIDGFHSSELSAKVLNWTYYSIKNLLASPKLLYVSERSILKNLGSWLGHLTLAREKPIFHRDLPIKDLILHAYKTDNLVAVLPFVSKILAKSEKSKIFKVPNPWLVAILRLYKELHGYPNLKQNLKFDIELLFQTLKLDLKTIEPSQFFHQYRHNNQSDQGVTNNGTSYDRQAILAKILPKNSNVVSFQQPILPSVTCHWMPGLAQTPQLAQFFSQQLRIKQFLYTTFDRAIEQIVNTVLDRVTAFATTTTQKIVLKDFAMESDETKLMRAAHCMVQMLSSSFTSVISRPSLKSFVEHVCHSQFTGFNDTVKQILQEAIEINLVVACSVIEKHVSKKAVTSIDQALRRAFEYRVMFREKQRHGSTQSFYDMEYLPKTGPYLPQTLPDLLKPQICSSSQMTVYENFLRLNELMSSEDQAMQNQVRQAQLSLQSQVLHQPHQYIDSKVNNLGRKAYSNQLPDKGFLPTNSVYSSLANAANPTCKAPKPSGNFELYDTAKAMHMFNNLIEELVTHTTSYFDTSNKTLLENPHISEALKRLTNFVAFQCQDRVAVAEKAACKVLESLCTNSFSNRSGLESQPIRSMYVHILFALARTSSVVTGCVTEWYARDKFQYDREITLAFLCWQLIRPSYFDTVLVRNLEKGCNIAAVKFAVYIIKTAMLRTQMPMLAGADIPHLLDELEIIGKHCPDLIPNGLLTAARSVQLFCPTMRARRTATQNDLFEIHGKQPFFYPVSSLTQRQQQLNRTLPSNVLSWFSDWVGLCQNSSIEGPPGHIQHQYIQQLQNLGLISLSKNVVPETESAFYRGIIEASALSYLLLSQAQSNIRLQLQLQIEPEKLEQSTTLALQPYLAPEACARLIFIIGTNHIDHNWLLQCALLQATSVINADHHNHLTEFNQRPYVRFFTTILTLFDQHSTSNKPIHLHFLKYFADFLFDCHPGKYPGFAFAWLELLSHKCFMPKLMKNHSAWPILHKLLLLQFNFIESCLVKGKTSEPIRALYEGTLGVLFVILHDNPDFLSGYYYTLCNALPPICVQLRNLILSATPVNVKLPELSSFSLDTHDLSGTEVAPLLLSDYQNPIIESNLKDSLDLYLRQPVEFEQFKLDLPSNLRFLPEISDKIGLKYDARLIGSIVLYNGFTFLTRPKNNAVVELYRHLSIHLDVEGRYHLFSSFFDHLRYLNSHTYFFCGMLLHFWELSANSSHQPSNQQIIARIIFERIRCNPPHPWGLLMLCQEISKNPKYGFARVIYTLDLDNEDILQSLYAKGYFISSFPEPPSSTLPL